jgi:molybdopterin-guanine dinucleotide biosynthesis protein A
MKTFGSAVILAGGKSRRMGFDKCNLMVDGKALIEHQIEMLKTEFDEIRLVTSPELPIAFPGSQTVYDEYIDSGPMGGIHQGLKCAASEYVYIIGCDMPNINLDYIRYMKRTVKEYRADICITANAKFVEPLNSFYSRMLVSQIESSLKSGTKSLHGLFHLNRTITIAESHARAFDTRYDMFINLNYLEEISRYENIRTEFEQNLRLHSEPVMV